jgi:hypothetical protein
MNPEAPKFSDAEILQIKMAIQQDLIRREEDSKTPADEIAHDWIKDNSPKFAKFFDQLLIERPDLINEYRTDSKGVVDRFYAYLLAQSASRNLDQAA